jgi:predicted RNA binding protein YcfA (HicA-like mRNA interferase family)
MSSRVTFKQLQKTLVELGFEGRQSGSHVIFRHTGSGAVLSVPNSEQIVRTIFVSTAARQVANSGIATTKAFEGKLRKNGMS